MLALDDEQEVSYSTLLNQIEKIIKNSLDADSAHQVKNEIIRRKIDKDLFVYPSPKREDRERLKRQVDEDRFMEIIAHSDKYNINELACQKYLDAAEEDNMDFEDYFYSERLRKWVCLGKIFLYRALDNDSLISEIASEIVNDIFTRDRGWLETLYGIYKEYDSQIEEEKDKMVNASLKYLIQDRNIVAQILFCGAYCNFTMDPEITNHVSTTINGLNGTYSPHLVFLMFASHLENPANLLEIFSYDSNDLMDCFTTQVSTCPVFRSSDVCPLLMECVLKITGNLAKTIVNTSHGEDPETKKHMFSCIAACFQSQPKFSRELWAKKDQRENRLIFELLNQEMTSLPEFTECVNMLCTFSENEDIADEIFRSLMNGQFQNPLLQWDRVFQVMEYCGSNCVDREGDEQLLAVLKLLEYLSKHSKSCRTMLSVSDKPIVVILFNLFHHYNTPVSSTNDNSKALIRAKILNFLSCFIGPSFAHQIWQGLKNQSGAQSNIISVVGSQIKCAGYDCQSIAFFALVGNLLEEMKKSDIGIFVVDDQVFEEVIKHCFSAIKESYKNTADESRHLVSVCIHLLSVFLDYYELFFYKNQQSRQQQKLNNDTSRTSKTSAFDIVFEEIFRKRNNFLPILWTMVNMSHFHEEEIKRASTPSLVQAFEYRKQTIVSSLRLITMLLEFENKDIMSFEIIGDKSKFSTLCLKSHRVSDIATYICFGNSEGNDLVRSTISRYAVSFLFKLSTCCLNDRNSYEQLLNLFRSGTCVSTVMKGMDQWLDNIPLAPSSSDPEGVEMYHLSLSIVHDILHLITYNMNNGPVYSLGHALLGYRSDLVITDNAFLYKLIEINTQLYDEHNVLRRHSDIAKATMKIVCGLCSNEGTYETMLYHLEETDFLFVYLAEKFNIYNNLDENDDAMDDDNANFENKPNLMIAQSYLLTILGIDFYVKSKSLDTCHGSVKEMVARLHYPSLPDESFRDNATEDIHAILTLYDNINVHEDLTVSYITGLPAHVQATIKACIANNSDNIPEINISAFCQAIQNQVSGESLQSYREALEKENTRYAAIVAKRTLIRSWRIVLEITLDLLEIQIETTYPTYLLAYLKYLLESLLTVKDAKIREEVSQAVLTLISKLRVTYAKTSGLESSQISAETFHELFASILRLFGNQSLEDKTKGNIYSVILIYLGLTETLKTDNLAPETSTVNMTSISYMQNINWQLEGLRVGNLNVLDTYIVNLMNCVIYDCLGGKGVTKPLALSVMSSLLCCDRRDSYLKIFVDPANDFLRVFIDDLIREDNEIAEALVSRSSSSGIQTLCLIETKLTVFLNFAKSAAGARRLIDLGFIGSICQCYFLTYQAGEDIDSYDVSTSFPTGLDQSRAIVAATLRVLNRMLVSSNNDDNICQHLCKFLNFYIASAATTVRTICSSKSISLVDIELLKEITCLFASLSSSQHLEYELQGKKSLVTSTMFEILNQFSHRNSWARSLVREEIIEQCYFPVYAINSNILRFLKHSLGDTEGEQVPVLQPTFDAQNPRNLGSLSNLLNESVGRLREFDDISEEDRKNPTTEILDEISSLIYIIENALHVYWIHMSLFMANFDLPTRQYFDTMEGGSQKFLRDVEAAIDWNEFNIKPAMLKSVIGNDGSFIITLTKRLERTVRSQNS